MLRSIASLGVATALIAGACSANEESRPVSASAVDAADEVTASTAVPSQDVGDQLCDAAMEPAPPEAGRLHLIADAYVAEPGALIPFSWPEGAVADGSNTGDETFVECWTTEGWKPAYAAFRLFGGAPEAIMIPETLDFDLDGWLETSGLLPVPDWAEPGWYRFEADHGVGSDLVQGEGRFVVSDRTG